MKKTPSHAHSPSHGHSHDHCEHVETDCILSFWDRIGITLSTICFIHCVLTSLVVVFLPLLAREYLTHPIFHILLALLILPIGLFAFVKGYRLHRNRLVLFLGFPGLLLVSVSPIALDYWEAHQGETILVSLGSLLLVSAHWINQRDCQSCASHHHS